MVWVLPEGVDYSHPSMHHPPCLRTGAHGYILSIDELASGDLETIDELRPPYAPADPRDVTTLVSHVRER